MDFDNLYMNQEKDLIVEKLSIFIKNSGADKEIFVTCYIVANNSKTHSGMDRFLTIQKTVFDREFFKLNT